MTATTQQERKALEQIRKIVAGLGEDSYIGTALEGCLDDAEANITDDAAYSMKGRYEAAVKNLEETTHQLRATEAVLATAKQQGEKLVETIAAKDAEIEALKKRVLPEHLRRDLWVMLTHEAETARKEMALAADTMAQFADFPTDLAFTGSVKIYRQEKELAETKEQMADALDLMEENS